MRNAGRAAIGFVFRSGAALKAVWSDAFLRRLALNSSWGIASAAIEFALSLAEIALVARALGVADSGRLALVIAVIMAIKLLVDVRAWEGATRYLAEFLAKREPALALATLKLAMLADARVGLVAYGTTVALAGSLSGRPDIATYAVAADVLMELLLLLLLAPRHGAMGAAVSLLGGSAAFAVSICALLARTLRWTPSDARAWSRPVVQPK